MEHESGAACSDRQVGSAVTGTCEPLILKQAACGTSTSPFLIGAKRPVFCLSNLPNPCFSVRPHFRKEKGGRRVMEGDRGLCRWQRPETPMTCVMTPRRLGKKCMLITPGRLNRLQRLPKPPNIAAPVTTVALYFYAPGMHTPNRVRQSQGVDVSMRFNWRPSE